jgi:hypothetical protein
MKLHMMMVLIAMTVLRAQAAAPDTKKQECAAKVDQTVRTYIQGNWVVIKPSKFENEPQLNPDGIWIEDPHFWERETDQQFRYTVNYYFRFKTESKIYRGKIAAKALDVEDGLPCYIDSLVYYRNTFPEDQNDPSKPINK